MDIVSPNLPQDKSSTSKRTRGRPPKKNWNCIKCGETDLSKFHVNSSGKRRNLCKKCDSERAVAWAQKNKERQSVNQKAWRKDNPDYVNQYKYGLSKQECQALLDSQNGVCRICDQPPTKGNVLHIDHCHATGKVRGFLCMHCNQAIGKLKHDPILLRKAADYLEE